MRKWEKIKGLDALKALRAEPEKWLPVPGTEGFHPRRNEYGEYNIGWNAGIIDGNRMFYAEVWATDGITMLTMYFSDKGIENCSKKEIDTLLQSSEYYSPREGYTGPQAEKFSDPQGNGFYSANIAVGYEDEIYIDGANIIPFSVLNEFNGYNEKGEEI